MRVLVIGGTGNISSAIVEALVARGDEVTILSRGRRADAPPTGVRMIQGDRHDPVDFEKALAGEIADAAIDMISFTRQDAESAVKALSGRVGHYVHCSTVCVYGVEVDRLPTEETQAFRPTGNYGKHKGDAERVLMAAWDSSKFPVTIMRPSWTYGRLTLVRQLGFDAAFVDRLRKGKPIVVVDSAEMTKWQALHIRDAAVAFVSCLGREKCFGNAYNLVGDEVMTWADYHRLAARGINAPEPELVPIPLEEILEAKGDRFAKVLEEISAYDGWYDNRALKRDVPEFSQTIKFEEGVGRNVEWMENQGLIANSDDDPWEDQLVNQRRKA